MEWKEILRRYHRSDKFFLIFAIASLLFGLLVPSGALGIFLFLVAKSYLDLAEEG